jgi:hypothetical protein
MEARTPNGTLVCQSCLDLMMRDETIHIGPKPVEVEERDDEDGE